MFSHNGKISEKQMQRMLILPVFASGIFVIPHLAACFFRESIIWGLLIFFVFACVYMGCIWGIAKWRENGKKAIGKPQTICDKILLPVQVVRLIIRQAFYVVLSIAILAEAQSGKVRKFTGSAATFVCCRLCCQRCEERKE